MKTSLTARFTVILITLFLAAMAVWYLPLRKGIDLGGGTSLLYELDLSKMPDLKESPATLAQHVIEILKKRVDPFGQKNMIWRVVGGKRIQIQMGLPDQKTLDARAAADAAVAALQAAGLEPSLVQDAITRPDPKERQAAMERVAAAGTPRYELLTRIDSLRQTAQSLQAALASGKPPEGKTLAEVQNEKTAADSALQQAQAAAQALAINFADLPSALAETDPAQRQQALTQLAPAGSPLQDILQRLAAAKTPDESAAAQRDLQAAAFDKPALDAALALADPAQRDQAFCHLAAAGTQRLALLGQLAIAQEAYDKILADIQSAKYPVGGIPQEVLNKRWDAKKNLDAASNALYDTDVENQSLQGLLTAADNPKNTEAQTALAALLDAHPEQRALIQAVIDTHRREMELSATGGGVDSPQDLERMVTGAGVLDFRIAVTPDLLGVTAPNQPPSAAMQFAEDFLQKNGPLHPFEITGTGIRARWFLIDPNGRDNFSHGGFVTAQRVGQPYVLCYDDSARENHTLTHNPTERKPWTVRASAPQADPTSGGLMLPFQLDPVGASYMGDLTSANKGRQMAILLDDKAMTAPTIQSTITSNGQITFGQPSASRPLELVKKEADDLKQIMDAGSLPAALQPEPISVVQITPDMGADNIRAGLHSAYYAITAVIAFMLFYYTITGGFADAAMLMNLLLVLAAMAAFRGTFTLPGIAGLVLTLGMAVDANILINERIREELHKGASLWMAIKQGYDRVFWTIFDANLTTSLTSIVLIYVGSEEVKGFGVTLLIGLMIHMYTALFVTRTLMMAGVRWGIIRAIDDHSLTEYLREIFTLTWLRNGHFPFMRVITISNFDWIGKRHIFWVVSAVITVAGMVAFLARGEDKYDIEFRGGTQVTIALKKGADLPLEQIRQRIEALSHKTIADPKDPTALRDLAGARVYGVGDPSEHRFEMQTTIANPPDDPTFVNKYLLPNLADAFKDVLDVKAKLQIAGWNDKDGHLAEKDLPTLLEKNLIRPIPNSANTLDDVFAGTEFQNLPRTSVLDYRGGTAIVLDNINAPATKDDLIARIRDTRGSQAINQTIPNRKFTIIPITAVPDSPPGATAPETRAGVPASLNDTRPLTRAIMLSLDTSQRYTDSESDQAAWRDNVAPSEWKVVSTAVDTARLFDGVTSFDAVVAGQAKQSALIAIILSLILIVIYVWIRFGGIRYGLGAILSLAHDAIVAVAGTVLSGVAYRYLFHDRSFLLITDFKINLTMIAAYLTVIGYSVNDTIVIFDRVREMRGKSTGPLTAKLVNDAINQCFGRTIWTTFTVFIVVLIMYIWGGEGIRGFAFAMLIGVFTGAYSTLAIASPMLLTTAGDAPRRGGGPGGSIARANPFLPKAPTEPVPQLNPLEEADDEHRDTSPGPAPA